MFKEETKLENLTSSAPKESHKSPHYYILGIESSCDDAAAAIFSTREEKLLSHIVSSQEKIHIPYGGVVPELASRHHFKNIPWVVDRALEKAKLTFDDMNLIAVTHAPGLVGSLLVGLSYAKALSYSKKIPFIGIHHIEAHLMAIHLEKKVDYPYIGLVVSGGHTSLYYVKDFGFYELMGCTVDDAAGETFDKVAKFCGLPFPGGPIIDKLAQEGNPEAIDFPKSFIDADHFQFSFSGLKTSVIQYVKKNPQTSLKDVLASFQEAIVSVLVDKTIKLAKLKKCPRVVVCGGVACNSRLRSQMSEKLSTHDIRFFVPSPILCSDNAAMIAYTGWQYWMRGKQSSFDLNALPNQVL